MVWEAGHPKVQLFAIIALAYRHNSGLTRLGRRAKFMEPSFLDSMTGQLYFLQLSGKIGNIIKYTLGNSVQDNQHPDLTR